MNSALPLILTLVSIAPLAVANDSHPIDSGLDLCLSQEQHYSTAGVLDCIDAATRQWDTELNDAYRELMSQLQPSQQLALKAAQRAWLSYRDREYETADAIYGGLEGTMYLPMHAMRVLRITKTRALELGDYLSLLR
ncbi:MAG: DUF1311 domain-containing protein [Oceanospirillaceae bacterium]|nr:DUF1311 domain-containing protein [Oceanospirillaceae bacterium]